MKIYKITEASAYLGVTINTLKTLANNGKLNSFKTTRSHWCREREAREGYGDLRKVFNGKAERKS